MRVGFWASTVLATLGAIYLALLVGYFTSEGFNFPPTPFVQTVGGLVTILSAPAILMQFAAIGQLVTPEKAVFASIAKSFTVLFVAMVSINRFVQLTIIRQSPSGTESVDLVRFLPYSEGSIMFALEILGWGLFLSLACLFMAPLFAGAKLQRSIRWTLVLFAIFSFMSVIGFVTSTPITAAAFIAWGPILLIQAILLAVLFHRNQMPSIS